MTILDDRSNYFAVKQDIRQKIIETGAELIHKQGFNHTGLKEILEASQVPKGSFYHYFKSKEDFGLALIEHFTTRMHERSKHIFDNPELSPLERIRLFFAGVRSRFEELDCSRGCPIGNLAQEVSDLSPAMRDLLSRSLAGMASRLAGLIELARQNGELSLSVNPTETAEFIVDAFEGALLRMKTDKSPLPLRRFEEMIFNRLLV